MTRFRQEFIMIIYLPKKAYVSVRALDALCVCWLYSLTRILNVFTYTISVGGYESKLSLYVVCKFFLYTSFFIIGFTIKTLEQTFKRGNSLPWNEHITLHGIWLSYCLSGFRDIEDFYEENESVFWQWIFIFDI